MATSSRLWVNNGFYPQETSVATLYQVLPRQRLDLFTIISSPRKFAECLNCDVTPPPTLHVLSRFIEFTCHIQIYSRTIIYSLYSQASHIHSYNYTFIHEYFHTLVHTQHIHNINSYMVAPVTQSLVWLYPIQSGLYLSLCLTASF